MRKRFLFGEWRLGLSGFLGDYIEGTCNGYSSGHLDDSGRSRQRVHLSSFLPSGSIREIKRITHSAFEHRMPEPEQRRAAHLSQDRQERRYTV